MKLNNHGWGMMEFLIIALIILMIIFIVAGQISSISNQI